MSNRFDDEHKEAMQNLQEEIDKLKRNLDEFRIRKRDRINYLPTETIQKHAERIKGLNDLKDHLLLGKGVVSGVHPWSQVVIQRGK